MSLSPQDVAFLEALERQLAPESEERRGAERHTLRIAVRLNPADASRLDEPATVGHTIDVSTAGARTEMMRPARVGDHYLLRLFTKEDQPVEVVARCLRCILLTENRFEVALRFLAPLGEHDLPLEDDLTF